MSLLEDVFLQDEASEAQELERVIEGDDDERPRSPSDSDENSEKEDEAAEDKRRVDPTQAKEKRVIKNPRFILNPARLTGPRGIQVLPEHFKDFRFKGKGHEKDDLDFVLKKLEHWAYRLYPKFQFEDCLKKIEMLGKKRPVMVHLHKIRSDQLLLDEPIIQKDSSDDENPAPPEEDEFDKLLQQQIDLARATPAPGSVRKGFETPSVDKRSPLFMTKATSSPSISDEQKERMIKNRQLAEEKRLAKLKQNPPTNSIPLVDINDIEAEKEIDEEVGRKHSRSNVIDSSEEESDAITGNQAVTVDIHDTYDRNVVVDITEHDIHKNSSINNDIVDLVGADEVATKVNTQNINGNNVIDITVQEMHSNAGNKVTLVDLIDIDKPVTVVDKNNTMEENGIIDITDKEICKKTNLNTEGTINLVDTDNAFDGNNTNIMDLIERDNRNTLSNIELTVVDLVADKAIEKRKVKRSIIDSSDDECAVISENQVLNIVDVHRTVDSDSNDFGIRDFAEGDNHASINDVSGKEVNINIEDIHRTNIKEHNKTVVINEESKETEPNSRHSIEKESLINDNDDDIEMIEETHKNVNKSLNSEEMQVDNVESYNARNNIVNENIIDGSIEENLLDIDFSDEF